MVTHELEAQIRKRDRAYDGRPDLLADAMHAVLDRRALLVEVDALRQEIATVRQALRERMEDLHEAKERLAQGPR